MVLIIHQPISNVKPVGLIKIGSDVVRLYDFRDFLIVFLRTESISLGDQATLNTLSRAMNNSLIIEGLVSLTLLTDVLYMYQSGIDDAVLVRVAM